MLPESNLTIQHGFLLTRQSRDRQGQTHIELWLATDTGPTQLIIKDEKPVFFLEQESVALVNQILASNNLRANIRSLELMSFEQQPLAACYCDTIQQANGLKALLEKENVLILESDIKLADRFLMERFIQGGLAFTGDYQQFKDYQRVTNAKCKAGEYTPKLSVVSLDLECSEKGILYSIGLDSPMDSRVIMIGEPQDAETNIQWV